MRTLKLSIVAILLASTVSLSANNNANSDEPVNQKVSELSKDVKANLSDWYSFEHIEPGEKQDLVVHYTVNEQNKVEVLLVKANEDKLKKQVFSTFERHPVEADPELKGEVFAIKVQLDAR